jgi:hypothetical protein
MKPVAAMILAAGLSTMAQAAETGTLTLACTGTTTAGYQGAGRDPISMGLIVSFTNGTVQGFGTPGYVDIPVKITGINDVTVVLGGDAEATQIVMDARTGKTSSTTYYSLKCRPTQRMF